MYYYQEASDLAPTADPYMTVLRPTRRPTRAHEAARNRSGRATTAATVALLPAQAWPRSAINMANRPIAQRSPARSAGGRTERSEMSVYMRGYDRGQERGRAEVGLSGRQRTVRPLQALKAPQSPPGSRTPCMARGQRQ
jgi:hypothetical protein